MSLKIIGTGWARTGTMSLKKALEHLNGGKCFHMVELLANPKKVDILKKGLKRDRIDWGSFYEGYHGGVDYPTCLFYKELVEENPKAKVIHTTREFDSWYKSVYETVYRGKPKGVKDIFRMIKNMVLSSDFRRVAPVFMLNDKLIWDGQFQSKFEDKEFMRILYRKHEEEVKRHVKAENLLIYNVKEGWKPLCDFLNKPIPQIVFPRENERNEFNRKMDRLLIDGVLET